MKTMTRFLTLMLTISVLNLRSIPEWSPKVGAGVGAAALGYLTYKAFEGNESTTSVKKTKNKYDGFLKLLASGAVAGFAAWGVHEVLSQFTPTGRLLRAQNIVGALEQYPLAQPLGSANAATVAEDAHLTAEWSLIAGFNKLKGHIESGDTAKAESLAKAARQENPALHKKAEVVIHRARVCDESMSANLKALKQGSDYLQQLADYNTKKAAQEDARIKAVTAEAALANARAQERIADAQTRRANTAEHKEWRESIRKR